MIVAASQPLQHTTGFYLVNFTNIKLQFSVVVAEIHPWRTIQALTDHVKS